MRELTMGNFVNYGRGESTGKHTKKQVGSRKKSTCTFQNSVCNIDDLAPATVDRSEPIDWIRLRLLWLKLVRQLDFTNEFFVGRESRVNHGT